jgi:hypothetical protein
MFPADQPLNAELKANESEIFSVTVMRVGMEKLYDTLVFNSSLTRLFA